MAGIVFACDSSTAICSVAVDVRGALYTEERDARQDHLKTMMPAIRRLFTRAGVGIGDVELSVCSRGPGSFVGLRIALNTVKGFYAGRGIPFVTIPTHEIYRHSYVDATLVAVVRATKRAYYIAVYRRGEVVTPVRQATIAELARLLRALAREYRAAPILTSVDGDLLARLAAEIAEEARGAGEGASPPYSTRVLPSSAGALCRLGRVEYRARGMAALDINPDYVRVIDAEKL